MRDRHRRSADRGLAIDLGVVMLDDIRLFAHQPLAADGEAAVTLAFLDAGFLQQGQGSAAGAEEYEAGLENLVRAALLISDRDVPVAIVVLAQGLDRMAELQLEIIHGGQRADHVAGRRAGVYASTRFNAASSHGLVGGASDHE